MYIYTCNLQIGLRVSDSCFTVLELPILCSYVQVMNALLTIPHQDGPGQHPNDRPDLLARVFSLKLKALMKDLTKSAVLGHVIAFRYVIEFQKRGLPHAHLLLTLAHEDKLHNANDYDRCCGK